MGCHGIYSSQIIKTCSAALGRFRFNFLSTITISPNHKIEIPIYLGITFLDDEVTVFVEPNFFDETVHVSASR